MYFIVVDAKSKWIEVLLMSSTTTAAAVGALRHLFSVHGLPEEIVSDNGPQFVAQEMKDFLKLNGIRQCLSSPYHPASNGEAERVVRTFKDAMKICKNEEGSVGEKLARFLLGYRTTPHTATGRTPAEILMGRRLRTRLDMLRPCLSAKMERSPPPVRPITSVAVEVGVTKSSTEGQPSKPCSTLPITQETNPQPPAQQLSSTVIKEPDATNRSEKHLGTRWYPIRIRTKPKRLIEEV